MSDPTNPVSVGKATASARLHELAQTLKTTDQIDATDRAKLADLVETMACDLEHANLPPEEANHLATYAEQLIHDLQRHPPHPGLLNRLQGTIAQLESTAPQAAGFLNRFMDALATLGI